MKLHLPLTSQYAHFIKWFTVYYLFLFSLKLGCIIYRNAWSKEFYM